MKFLIKYTHEAGSPTDKRKWLGFPSETAAQAHAARMNELLKGYDSEDLKYLWNKEAWPTKPEPWIVRELATPEIFTKTKEK